jgi:hypothetical protein
MLKSACLVLAPHLTYPTRNGADILIDRRWAEFSRHVDYVDILGSNVLVRYENGVRVSVKDYSNRARSKIWASILTVVRGSHYLLEKLITQEFVYKAKECLVKPEYRLVVFSYISTASLAILDESIGRLYCVETHNDEVKWFKDMRYSSGNPLVKMIAWLSEVWLLQFMRRNDNNFLYLHVTKADQSGYDVYFPKQKSYVAPVGCDLSDRLSHHRKNYGENCSVKLLFVGSLNVKMNFDAIKHFSEKFYPVITQNNWKKIEVRIVGSNPTIKIVQLCSQMGWSLLADASEDELTTSYDWADFSILPFAYATGGKLKLLKSLSLGVPFLATGAVCNQLYEIDQTCLVSDFPSEWLDHIRKIKGSGISQQQRNELMASVQKYSWSRIAADLHQHLNVIS